MRLWAIVKGSKNLPDGSMVEIDLSYSKGQATWGFDKFVQVPDTMPVIVTDGKNYYIVLKKHLTDFWVV